MIQLEQPYTAFLKEITSHIQKTRTKAVQMVNREAISLYAWIGQHISESQEKYGWGKSIVETLSFDLSKSFPGSKFGFSPRNLWDMRRFYLEYKDCPKLRHLVAELSWACSRDRNRKAYGNQD